MKRKKIDLKDVAEITDKGDTEEEDEEAEDRSNEEEDSFINSDS